MTPNNPADEAFEVWLKDAQDEDRYPFSFIFSPREIAIAREAWNARVPAGYCIVPREPTERMCSHGFGTKDEARRGYKAMIAAAEGEVK